MKSASKLLCLLALACSPLYAKQIEYSQAQVGDSTRLTFRWEDHTDMPQGIIISVLNEDIRLHMNDPKMKIKPQDLKGFLYKSVQMQAQALSSDGYSIEVSQDNDRILISGKGRDKSELERRIAEVENSNETALRQLDETSYYTMIDGSLRLDYSEIVEGSRTILSPIAQYLTPQGSDLRTAIDSYLPFLQSIPYDRLDGTEQFGLYTPMHMLLTNRGDCESKQLALATMIKSQFPAAEVIMLGLVDHVVVGVAMTPQAGDQTFMHNGKQYILMDATGPHESVTGEIAPREIERMKQNLGVVYPI